MLNAYLNANRLEVMPPSMIWGNIFVGNHRPDKLGKSVFESLQRAKHVAIGGRPRRGVEAESVRETMTPRTS